LTQEKTLTNNLISVPIEIPTEITTELPDFNPVDKPTVSKLPWLNLRVKSGDSLSSIFKRNRLKQLYNLIQVEHSKQLLKLRINQELHIKHDDNNVKKLILILNKTDELHIFQTENKEFESEIRPIGRTTKTLSVHGIVKTTLLAAAEQADVSKQQLDKLMDIFIHDIDFKNDIQAGDRFSIVYKQYQFGNDIEEGDILVAEIINKGKIYQALRYTNEAGNTDYYTPNGAYLKKISLLTAPITSFKRLSSHFGTRKHPILGRNHLHTGVDYSASHGVPIIAAGDAKIKFKGRKGGYGKVIILEHNSRVQTLYAHMSKFAKSLKIGSEVLQGDIIGYVGNTGRTTGSHLHYEVLIDNKHKNPLDFKVPFSLPILKQAHFRKKTKKLLVKLNNINKSSTRLAHVSTLGNIAGISIKIKE
ncbi:M23 family metallopeptidase, partial [Candidatus Halobeggiatoa sp. HSG11]|nr:M23 family metallopeptidase [Candidatus Halobeggiatoa sp. HSG11]